MSDPSFDEIAHLEAKLFPTEVISVTQKRLNELLDLPYQALQIRRNDDQSIDGICLSVFIDDRIETWLLKSMCSRTVYDLPRYLVGGLSAESDAIWLDLVAGLSPQGKVWAVRQAYRKVASRHKAYRVYSFAMTDAGKSLSTKLGMDKAGDFGLYKNL